MRGPLEEMHAFRTAIVDALKLFSAAQRPVYRKGSNAQNAFELVEQLERIAARPVELIHEGEERNAALGADCEELFGLGFYTLSGIDEHHGAIGGQQRAIGILAEVLVTRRIEQVEGMAAILEL